ncbi:hypothetical protein XH94_10270 [Bradyrhizobium zhanjiangense]|uniref:Uncharacterized protein n=1 Tax=Bradyrhizobium zhanjiangense TaxID=1325107 RepID=A0A4Q0SQ53_9BRAD|nr:hypothetical protein XH94_10270 [Bradyrhizobium zhanjiangense]
MKIANRLRFAAALFGSMTIGISAASAHHPGIGGIGGAGGIFTIGAGTLDEGQFAFSTFVDYLRLKQLSEPTLLANVGNDVPWSANRRELRCCACLWHHQ